MGLDTSVLDAPLQARVPAGLGGRWYGVYPALVSDIKDPDSMGRVKITLPWSPDPGGQKYEAWARVATLMGGNQRGSWFIPDMNDEVLVMFEAGDARRPYVIGGLWNGTDAPPESMDGGGKNYKKVLKSRNGVKVTLDDTDGQEKFIAETPGGQKVTLKDGPGAVEIADSNGNSIKLESAGVTITAGSTLTINASVVTINSSSLTQSGTATVSGALTVAASVTTPSVISGSYTPGAGNVW
jgi:uncharacterized protein involved in type VI secretion and phage assembly